MGDLKPQCALYVSNTTYSLLLLGLDKMRNPMFSFYDTRSMGKAVDSKSLSFSTGFLLPLYDIDTELLMIGVRVRYIRWQPAILTPPLLCTVLM